MHSFDYLLKEGIDFSVVNFEYVCNWAKNASNIFSLFFILIFMPIFLFYVPKKAMDKFKKKHPDENVLYASKNNILFILILLYCIGGLFGNYIMPFFYFKNTFNICNINLYEFLLFIAIWIFFALIMGLRLSLTYVFSNKRIELINVFDFYEKFVEKRKKYIEKQSISYKDIIKVEDNGFDCIDITGKNNEKIHILFRTNTKVMKKVIENNKGENNE